MLFGYLLDNGTILNLIKFDDLLKVFIIFFRKKLLSARILVSTCVRLEGNHRKKLRNSEPLRQNKRGCVN